MGVNYPGHESPVAARLTPQCRANLDADKSHRIYAPHACSAIPHREPLRGTGCSWSSWPWLWALYETREMRGCPAARAS